LSGRETQLKQGDNIPVLFQLWLMSDEMVPREKVNKPVLNHRRIVPAGIIACTDARCTRARSQVKTYAELHTFCLREHSAA
jgi:hypothetical protein